MLGKYNNITYSVVWFVISIVLCAATSVTSSFAAHTVLVIANLYSYYRCLRIWVSGGNSYISLYTFFILYMCASNLGQSVLSLIPSRMSDLSVYESFVMDDIVEALRFQLVSVAGLGLGTSLWVCRNVSTTKKELLDTYHFVNPYNYGNQTLLKILFFFSALLVFSDAISYFLIRQSMGYMDAYTERQLEGIPLYMQFANWLIILLGYYFALTKRFTKPIIWGFSALIVIFLICGNRSLTIKYLAFLLLFCPIAYPQYFKKKYLSIWAIVGVLLIAMMSVVSYARNDVGSALQNASGQHAIGEMLIDSFSEMGGSLNTLIYTMDAIGNGFRHHLTELNFIVTAVASSALCGFLGIENEYLPLGEWVGEYAGIRSYGLGYSCLAEWFMNYGWSGCLFAVFYGYLISMAESISYKSIVKGDYLLPSILLTFLSTQIFYARSSLFYSLFDVRFGLWLIILYKLSHIKKNEYVYKKTTKKNY